ncbi:MAG: AAA family ATPase, partial [bacterium]
MSRKIKEIEGDRAAGSTGDLFPEHHGGARTGQAGPLADRMRPATLDRFVGQTDLMAEGAILRKMIEEDRLASVIFWGPPGSGKTTLARLIADRTGSLYMSSSAVTSGSREMKEVMKAAKDLRRRSGRRTILFVDEVHRFNKAQQDAFLPYVESGDVILIGATTENPSFEVNAALLSRSKVFVFTPLSPREIEGIVRRALEEDAEISGMDLVLTDEAMEFL